MPRNRITGSWLSQDTMHSWSKSNVPVHPTARDSNREEMSMTTEASMPARQRDVNTEA
jgi:hypothetical protein